MDRVYMLKSLRGGVEPHKSRRIVIIVFLLGLYFVWSIYNDIGFFYWDGSYNPRSIAFYCSMKIIVAFLMMVLGCAIYRISLYPKEFMLVLLQRAKHAWLVVIFYFVLLLVLWPGNWGVVGDEYQIYLSVKNLRVWLDQGIFSSAFMCLCLMIYPHPGIISLIQCIISVVLLGDVLYKFHEEYHNKIVSILMTLLFVSLPALCFVLCPIRAWLYSILLIALLENIFFISTSSNESGQKRAYIVITLICMLVANYRKEGMIFALICPVVIIIFGKLSRQAKKWFAFGYIGIFILFTVFLRGLIWLGNGQTLTQHSGYMLVCPLSIILTDEEKYAQISDEDLANIDKVYDIAVMQEYPSMIEPFQWKRNERSFDEPSSEEMSAFMKSAAKIIISNKWTFLECKWEAAKQSLGIYPFGGGIGSIWTKDRMVTWNELTDLPGDMTNDFPEVGALRERVSHSIVYPFKIRGISAYYIFYAFWFPCLLLPICLIWNLIKKNYLEATISLTLCVQLILVILTAPSRFQMYYLSFYFAGWYMLARLLAGIKRCKHKSNEKIVDE